MFYLDTEQDERTAIKTAVALAISRYRDSIGKFVQAKSDRLSIVGDQVDRIARECAEAAKADPEVVEEKFRAFLAEEVDRPDKPAVAVTEPEKQNVEDSAEYNNSDDVPQPSDGVRDDVKSGDPVLDGRPESVDLGGDTAKSGKVANPNAVNCPYCGHTMTAMQNPQNPAMAGQQQQCPNCGATVMSTPGGQPGQAQPGFQQGMQTGIGGGLYAKCARCEKESAEEDSILCEACNHFVVTGEEKEAVYFRTCPKCGEDNPDNDTEKCKNCGADISNVKASNTKEAQGGGDLQDPDSPMDEQTQSPVESDPENTPQLPPAAEEDSNGPAEVYTGVVTETANASAAMAWSTPGDQDIQDIAQQYGIDPDQVRSSLRIVADFGDALAVNGDPNADPSTDGMVELPEFGGRIPTTEEEVDVDNAISHTADRTGLSADDVYALVKESYGGDIGGQHYVSVSGEAHYYLPQELVPQQQEPQPDVDQPTETPQEAYQSSVPAHLRSLTAFLDWEKAQLVQSA